MKNRFLIFLFLLFNCSFVFSQITTDRPDQTESAVVLPTGQIQIESGISIEDSQSNINTLFRIGIIEGIEIRLNSNYLINDELSFMKKSSFSDFEVGAKFRIFDKTSNNTKVAKSQFSSIFCVYLKTLGPANFKNIKPLNFLSTSIISSISNLNFLLE